MAQLDRAAALWQRMTLGREHTESYPEFFSRVMAAVVVDERSAGSAVPGNSATGNKQSR